MTVSLRLDQPAPLPYNPISPTPMDPNQYSILGAKVDLSVPSGAGLTPFGLSWATDSPACAPQPPAAETLAPLAVSADPAAQDPAPAKSPTADPAAAINDSSPETLAQAMTALNDQLTKDGVDTSAFTLTPREDLVWSPFGNYYSRQIELRTQSGNWELLSADLTLKSPEIAVCDVRRVLGETNY